MPAIRKQGGKTLPCVYAVPFQEQPRVRIIVCQIGELQLRDPVALRLPGFTLSLRNNEADYIVVEPLEQAG